MQGGPCTVAGGIFAVTEVQGSENLYGNHYLSPVQWLLTGILNEWVVSKLIPNCMVQFESLYIVHVKLYLKVIQKIMLKKKKK